MKITVIAEFSVALAAENVRDLRRTAGMTSHRSPAPRRSGIVSPTGTIHPR